MPQMNFDLEDGKPPVSFGLKSEDCERFVAFMAECNAAEQEVASLRAQVKELTLQALSDSGQAVEELSEPMRAFRLTLRLDGDDREAMGTALMNLAIRIERENLSTGVSGGCDSGYCYELLSDPAMTHEKYFADLDSYLRSQKSIAASRSDGGAG